MKLPPMEPPKINEYPLEAEVKEIEYTYFFMRDDGIPEVHNKKLIAKLIPIDLIADAVTQMPSEALEISVLEEMKFPIILTYNTAEEHRAAVRGLSNAKVYQPEKPFLNIIGNQRTEIARRNDFSHIHAFIVDTGREALIVKKTYDDDSATK